MGLGALLLVEGPLLEHRIKSNKEDGHDGKD